MQNGSPDNGNQVGATPGNTRSYRILVSGSSGLIGSALLPYLRSSGHTAHALVRRAAAGNDERFWDPPQLARIVSDYDAVIHLAGENIAGRRWSTKQKEKIRSSRIETTQALAKAIVEARTPPTSFLGASAIGIYGSLGDLPLSEETPPGQGFLAEVGTAWEKAARSVESHGVRVVALRFGVVLDPRGGALAKMLLPFRLGLGGKLGDGKQWMSWIALEDAIRSIRFVLDNSSISGPLNIVAPTPVRNDEFTAILGRVLRRPAVVPVPRFILKALFGQMADEALLASTRALPHRLLEHGFSFHYPTVESALQHSLR